MTGMTADALALGVLDSSSRIPDPEVARLCRNLTLSWSRRDFRGPLFEGGDVARLFDDALAAGCRYLFLQTYGHVIARAPGPKGAGATAFLDRLLAQAREVGDDGVLAFGESIGSSGADAASGGTDAAPDGTHDAAGSGGAAADRSLLVDLDGWARRGRPRVEWDKAAGVLRFGRETGDAPDAFRQAGRNAVAPFSAAVRECAVDLHPEDAGHGAALLELAHGGLQEVEAVLARHALDGTAQAFLRRLATLVVRSPEGIFPWNFEGYEDVVAPPASFRGPVTSLYAVAAGFKPNAILEHHGFDAATRVVLFDYSANALDIRRWLIEVWDGRDFPAVLRAMLERFPPGATFYHLPGMEASGSPDWERIAELWDKELADWGGARQFARHWQAYRGLAHTYVHANLLSEGERAAAHVRDEPAAIAWWSNVFYSAYALWHYGPEQRRGIYRRWVRAIAAAAPRLLLYGCDDLNREIEGAAAAPYAQGLGPAEDE